MARTKKEYRSLLNETVKHYSTEGVERGMDSRGDCLYYSDGNTCAVGRCLTNPKDKDRLLNLVIGGGGTGAGSLLSRFSDKIFKKEYRGFSVRFWEELQALHDTNRFWKNKSKGLTTSGKEEVSRVKRLINELDF